MHTSTNFSEKFTDAFGENRRIPALVCTRWNSLFKQIASITTLDHSKLTAVCNDASCSELNFSPREWLQLKELVDLLQPFYEATVLTQEEETPTISLVLPTVISLQKHLQEFLKKNAKYLKVMAEQLMQSFSTRFCGIFCNTGSLDINPILSSTFSWSTTKPFGETVYVVAATLDPMFGLQWIEEIRASDEEKEKLTTRVKGEKPFLCIK